MHNRLKDRRGERGFTLVELLAVAAIIVILSVIAIPAINTAVQDFRLRSAAGNVSGMLQRARLQAVKENRFYTVRYHSANRYVYIDSVIDAGNAAAATGSGDSAYYAGAAGAQGESMIPLPTGVTIETASLPSAPTAAQRGYSTSPSTSADWLGSFDARGMPCVKLSTNPDCKKVIAGNAVGFVIYMKDIRNKWVAVSVTPSGRVFTLSRSGTTWN